jgi:hypothetical protein
MRQPGSLQSPAQGMQDLQIRQYPNQCPETSVLLSGVTSVPSRLHLPWDTRCSDSLILTAAVPVTSGGPGGSRQAEDSQAASSGPVMGS